MTTSEEETKKGSITWLHLSDLHSCRPNTGWKASHILEKLQKDFENLQKMYNLRPDLIFFTGDAAFGHIEEGEGKSITYQFLEAANLINRICKSFKPEIPIKNVFIVPGNHDVNRREVIDMLHHGLDHLNNRQDEEVMQELSKLIQDKGKNWQAFLERLKDYRLFLESSGFKHILQDQERLIYGQVREINGVKVGIAGLNSAWSCYKDGEKGKLWLAGHWQIQTLSQMVKTADVKIALMHHPFNWFNPVEDKNLKRMMGNHFHFFLHGHEHDDWVEEQAKGFITISAGACYGNSPKEIGYNMVQWDAVANCGKVWLRCYEPKGEGWIPNIIYGKTDNTKGFWVIGKQEEREDKGEKQETDKKTISMGDIVKIRIFVSSPSDVLPERKSLEKVVKMFNKAEQLADRREFVFEILEWRAHTSPEKELQVETLNNMHVEKWDMFVGILWKSFDSPTEFKNHDGIDYPSGTKDDFYHAYEYWKREGRPYFLLYRCHREYSQEEMKNAQPHEVPLFFDQFLFDDQPPDLYKTFKDKTQFEEEVSRDIKDYVEKIKGERFFLRQHITSRGDTDDHNITPFTNPGETVRNDLKDGKMYYLTFLSIDMVGHSNLYLIYPENSLKNLLNEFHDQTFSAIRSFGGDEIHWAGDGGIFVFWGNNAFDNAVLVGINLLLKMIVFNLKHKIRFLSDFIKVRIAAHSGPAVFQIPFGKIHSKHLNFVAHLEKNSTDPNTFSVTKNLYEKLNDVLKKELTYKKKYLNTYIYCYKIPLPKTAISEKEMQKIVNTISDYSDTLLERLKAASLSNQNVSTDIIRRNIDQIYSTVDSFADCFVEFDQYWSHDYFKLIIKYINNIFTIDDYLYKEINNIFSNPKTSLIDVHTLKDISTFFGIRKSNTIPKLQAILKDIKSNVYGYLPSNLQELIEKIDKFIKAQPVEMVNEFYELFMTERENIYDFLLSREQDERHQKFKKRIWEMADYVLIEDLTYKSSDNREKKLLFPILSDDDFIGSYFKVVQVLIKANIQFPLSEMISSVFREFGIETGNNEEPDHNVIVQRCLLVGIQDFAIKRYIVNNVEFKELWGVIGNFKTPLEVIWVIAEYLEKSKDENRMKIFFDLVQNRLLDIIKSAQIETILHQIRLIIVIFYRFNFFAETGYFERLEHLRLSFTSKSEIFPTIKLRILEEYLEKLKNLRHEKRDPSATIPEYINELPLPIQRRLAREKSHYLWHFITSSNNTIAQDTIPHINSQNIKRVVKFPTINLSLLTALLKNQELFEERDVIFTVLNNPKCNPHFARGKIEKMNSDQLISILRNRQAKTEVKEVVQKRIENILNILNKNQLELIVNNRLLRQDLLTKAKGILEFKYKVKKSDYKFVHS